nr:Hsp20/alpha crystallin family protein [Halorussus sp. DT72]
MTLRDISRSLGSAVLQRIGRAASKVQESKPLPVDLLESDDAYLVVFDAPGATGSDVQVRYADGGVHVRIDRFRDFYDGFEMLFPGRGLSLDGQADLPADAVVDAESATATLTEHGTLRVRVPKQVENADESRVESAEA